MIPSHLTYEPEPAQVTYGYDKLNRLTAIEYPGLGTVGYEYFDCCNLRKKVTYPNGSYSEYAYDDFKNLKVLTNTGKDGIMISSYSYDYDENGNRTKMIEGVKNQTIPGYSIHETEYGYDGLNQLINVRYFESPYDYETHSYNYDSVGNRIDY